MVNTKIAVGAALAGAFVLGALAMTLSSAQSGNDQVATEDTARSVAPKERVSTSFSELEEDEIGAIVRSYLLENPEVIIEAVNEYQIRQQVAAEERARAGAANNLVALLDEETSFVTAKNPKKASIAVIEMYDYHCGFCKRAADIVRDMAEKDDQIQVVLRELPILRQESDFAAEMSLAARSQGKFLDLHFALMNASGVLTKERVREFASKQGLDVEAMEAEIAKGEIPAIINFNHQLASEMSADGQPVGTPQFIVASLNGEYVEVINGFRPDEITAAVADAKKAAEKG